MSTSEHETCPRVASLSRMPRAHLGSRVRVVGVKRLLGREGVLREIVSVSGGQHDRVVELLVVDLEARGRARARTGAHGADARLVGRVGALGGRTGQPG